MARVQIVIPFYNQRKFLEECLRSVCGQEFQDWEAVVVDDASEEACEDILRQVNDRRVKLIRHPVNRGLASARNTGVRASSSPWILPLDSDDRLSPSFLSQVMEVADHKKDVDAVFTDHLCFGEKSYIKKRYVQSAAEVLDHHSIPGAGTLYKRELWEKTGGYCESALLRSGNEDWDFWLCAYEMGFTPFHIPNALYEYRRYQGSMVTRLQLHDYNVRFFLYYRHRRLFEKYRMRSRFLARGFENSARASRAQGSLAWAWILSLAAILFDLRNKKLLSFSLELLKSVIAFPK